MTLDEFVIEVNDNIYQFRKDWLKKRKETNDNEIWPLEMQAGDWYEQFINYDIEEGLR